MYEYITLAHGSGGRLTDEFINDVFKPAFENSFLTADDAAVLPFSGGKLAFTTDGFVVSPYFFAGGDIGKLSICGTVNDLACMGAKPLYITCSFIIEEGFPVCDLKKITASMAETIKKTGAVIVAGDTKVVSRGQCDGIYITTSGVGAIRDGVITGGNMAKPGDAVIVTGDIGRHGACVLVARGLYEISSDIESDCAPLWSMVDALLNSAENVHCIRDCTRGGVATVLYEIASRSGVCVEIEQEKIPVSEPVSGICGLLGLEPLYLACEGRMVIFLPQSEAEKALESLRGTEHGKGSCVIGKVIVNDDKYHKSGSIIVKTKIGGRRLLAPPSGELLPRIC